ncbi:MAG: HAMP domain-containing protein [Anaerolineae bacterium]|nr:HAMP domain-containing protein [Anaerolineae bacterium]
MTKVTLMVVFLIMLTATGVGLTSITTARSLMVENSLSELGSDVEINSVRLVADIEALRNDTIFLSNLPEVQGIRRAIEAGGVDPVDLTTDALWRTQLIGVFTELLVSKPNYVTLQYISTDEALELVRVENFDGVIRAMGRRELNIGVEDGFFLNAQTLASGAVYLSDIGLQRDQGVLHEPRTIIMYASTPIYSDDGSVFGVVAIGLDFGAAFDELLEVKHDHAALYVTNQAGDYLLNTVDPALAFGFETGQQYRIQDSYEALAPMFEPNNALQELPASPDTGSGASAIHFRRVPFDQLTPDRFLGVAVATPYSEIVGSVNSLLDQGVLVTIALASAGIVLAVFVMRRLIRPLYQITVATQQISEGQFDIHLPIQSQDEFGQLASGFNQMAEAVQEREQALTDVNQSLERRVEERTLELSQARDEALASQRIAQENSRLKSEFLSTMSHELRTPLNAIEGFTSIMLGGMGIELSPPAEDMVKRVSANSNRLLHLINDFLDLSRIESGRLELVKSPVSPMALAQRWQNQVSILGEEKGLGFNVYVDPDLPPTLMGDEDALSKIAVNLLGNAFKFTHQGEVSLDLCRENGNWTIAVSDTGIGIPTHAREYIFEEFRQVDGSSKRLYGGTGLGLALVQKLARAMGGSVSLDSEVGRGSTFIVTLPLETTEEGVSA